MYKPHALAEVEALATEGLLTQEVVVRLCSDKRYGIWWFNRERITRQRVAEATLGGRLYRDKVKATAKARKEWIAVPVPNSGIPREVVDAAQEAIIDNKPTSSNGHRFWELSGGILRCATCRLAMRTHVAHKGNKRFYYYHCRRHHEEPARCANRKHQRAEKVERQVRDLVYEAMTNPEQLRADLDRMIGIERQALRGEPDREARTWLEKLVEVDRMRSGYQEMAAKGLMTFEELDARLEELKNTHDTAAHELEALRSRQERIEQMEQDRNALLESYASMAPQALEDLMPEECHQLYKMLRLEVAADEDGEIEVTGPIMVNPVVCNAGSAY